MASEQRMSTHNANTSTTDLEGTAGQGKSTAIGCSFGNALTVSGLLWAIELVSTVKNCQNFD